MVEKEFVFKVCKGKPRKHYKEHASKHVHYFVIQLKLRWFFIQTRCGETKIVGESECTVENLLCSCKRK